MSPPLTDLDSHPPRDQGASPGSDASPGGVVVSGGALGQALAGLGGDPSFLPEGGPGSDEAFMREALAAAERAASLGEVPVGAVVVAEGRVLAVGHNERETGADPTAHAEIVVLRRAAAAIGRWRLTDADLFVTMEPCPMCAGALVNARVRRVIYGCDDPKAGAARTLYRILDDSRLNHRVEVVPGVLAAPSAALLRAFFERLRR